MLNASQIKPEMRVVCSNNGAFAKVDHMEGKDVIKLNKDKNGEHHYIPLSWVTKVDSQVHIDRPGDQAMKEWSKTPDIKQASAVQPKSDKLATDRATNEGMKNPAASEKKEKFGRGSQASTTPPSLQKPMNGDKSQKPFSSGRDVTGHAT